MFAPGRKSREEHGQVEHPVRGDRTEDGLGGLLRELSMELGQAPSVADGASPATGRSHRGLEMIPGLLSAGGSFRGRPASVGFGGSGDMFLAVRYQGHARLSVCPRRWLDPFGFMRGRRVRSGDERFDRAFVVRTQGNPAPEGLLSDAVVRREVELLMPFRSLVFSRGLLRLDSSYGRVPESLAIMRKLESVTLLAGMVEKTCGDADSGRTGGPEPYPY